MTTLGLRDSRRLSLLVCSVAVFVVMLDGTVVNVALPVLARQFGAGLSGLQWVIDAYLIVLASLLLTSGAAGDRLGRRRVFRAGLVIFTIGSAACSVASSLGMLIVFRMVQAVGASMLPPTSLSIIASTFPDRRERAQAMGVWGAVSGLSTASGPLLGGALIHLIGWRAIFWINIPIGITGLLLASRYVEDSRAARPRRIDLPGQILAGATLALLSFGLIQAPAHGWLSPLIVSLLVSSVVAAAAFVVVERRRTEPLLELRFFTDRAFSGAAAVATLVFVCLTGFTFISTLYLQNVRGDSPLTAGLSLLPATAIVVVAAPLSGRLTGRVGPRLPVLLAAGSITAGMSVLAMTAASEPYWRLSIGYLLVGIGVGLVNAPITTTAVSSLPPDQAGVAAGVTGTARQVGSVVGVTLLGSIVISHYHSLLSQRPGNTSIAFTEASHWGFLLAAGCGAVAALIAAVTFRPNDRRKQT
jgi:EmrB/QacA subfamily drug resistance transporter